MDMKTYSKKIVNQFYQDCKAKVLALGGIEVKENLESGYCLHLNTTAGVFIISPSRNQAEPFSVALKCQWENMLLAKQKGMLSYNDKNPKDNYSGTPEQLLNVLDKIGENALPYKGAEYSSTLFVPKGVKTKIVVI